MKAVLSLSLEDFLPAFRRFAARRGEPHQIISDNASTFQASPKLLQIRLCLTVHGWAGFMKDWFGQ